MKQIFYLLSLVFFVSCQPKPQAKDVILAEEPTSENYNQEKIALATSVGTQAYLFGTSIVTQHLFRNRMRKMIAVSQKSDKMLQFSEAVEDGLHFNELIHTRNLVTHHMKIGGSANVDTRYSIIFFDLSEGTQILEVPVIEDRYFSINITDAYLGNRPYICSRLGNTAGGKYVFVGPDYKGDLPKDLEVIQMPQNNFLVVIRILVKDKDDNPTVTAIQDQFSFTSLNEFQGKGKATLKEIQPIPMPQGLEYFGLMTKLIKANPTEGNQDFIWDMLDQVGISKEETFDADQLDPSIQKGLLLGLKNGQSILKWRSKERGQATKTGWFYNLGLGEDVNNYMFRSEWAVQGLTVNSSEEAIYFNIFKDSEGNDLDGKYDYQITLTKDQLPPVDAFWSITSYNADFDLVQNEEHHYSVSDRSNNLKYNEDGSLTIHVQHKKPESGTANWISTPENGMFKLNFRFYNPKPVMFDKNEVEKYLPPLNKVKLKG